MEIIKCMRVLDFRNAQTCVRPAPIFIGGSALGIEAASFFAFSQKRYSEKPDPKGNAQNIQLETHYI